MPDSTTNRKSPPLAPTGPVRELASSLSGEVPLSPGAIGNGPLRPLRRLRQLAEEIQSALAREDMILVRRASSLLGPALAQWAERRAEISGHYAEIDDLSRETQVALADCEEAIRLLMARNRARANDIRQHRGRNRRLRAHHDQPLKSRILRSA